MTAKLKPSERNLLEILHNNGPMVVKGFFGLGFAANSSWPTVRKALKVLEERGFIEWDQEKANEMAGDAFRITDAGRKALGE